MKTTDAKDHLAKAFLGQMGKRSLVLQSLLEDAGYKDRFRGAGIALVSCVARFNGLRDWPDTQTVEDYDKLINAVRQRLSKPLLKTFTVINGIVGPEAFLVEQKLTAGQYRVLHKLAGGRFFIHGDLAKRWGLFDVLATHNWASEQRHQKPMFRPKGQRMAIMED